ncbi:MAG: pantetheine-phosphate adenylyltransferase [Candidatus Cloacimonetes bacterium]|nr:pantetheine-phosphate adenylyltransferase [Candidatus Cloacimonadota bacterium]
MKRAIYPGTFDPITYGHLNILTKATDLFDDIVLAVANVTSKNTLFTTDERYELCKNTIQHVSKVRVEKFDGLAIRFAEEMEAKTIIRGLRAVSDFEYELQLSLMNKNLNPNIETIFLLPDSMYLYLSSSMVRQIVGLGGNLKSYIPFCVEEAIIEKLQNKNN